MSAKMRSGHYLILALALTFSLRSASAQKDADLIASSSRLLQAGHYDEAQTLLTQALQKDPTNIRLNTTLGIAREMAGRNGEALHAFQTALRVEPGYLAAMKGEAEIFYKTNDPRVGPTLRHILKLDPKDTTAEEMLGLTEARSGHCSLALPFLSNLQSEHAEALMWSGVCRFQMHDLPGAQSSFEKLLLQEPANQNARYDLALTEEEEGNRHQAFETLRPALTASADVTSLAFGAELAENTGNTPLAANYLRQAIMQNPDQPEAYVQFAELCMTHESYAAGIEFVSLGLQRMPRSAPLLLARGMLYGG
jgi:cytochrome c-type biogenesis protein CcmH/NrfG